MTEAACAHPVAVTRAGAAHPRRPAQGLCTATALLWYLMLVAFDVCIARQVSLLRKEEGNDGDGVEVGARGRGSGTAAARPLRRSSSALTGGVYFPKTFQCWLNARMEIVNFLSCKKRELMKALEVLMMSPSAAGDFSLSTRPPLGGP